MSETAPNTDAQEEAYARACTLHDERRFAEAVEVLRGQVAQAPRLKVVALLGSALYRLGELDEAERWLQMAVAYHPQNVGTRHLLGNVYSAAGKAMLAEIELRTALAFDPEAHHVRLALAGLYLSLGRWPEGWPLLEARELTNPDAVPPVSVSFPKWRGEPLEGKSILVWYEQGLGDQIQMSRFATTLKERGASRVALGCRPSLVDLFATLRGADEVIPVERGKAVALRSYDYWSRYFSLPASLGITPANLPAQPYLSAPADRREGWAGYSGVGFVWRASPTGFNAAAKGLPDDIARQFLDRGVVSLHPEDTGVSDFADTAGIETTAASAVDA